MSSIYEDVETLKEQVAALQTALATMESGHTFIAGQAIATNEKLNGKTVYCKIIDIGALPNSTNKRISTGLDMNTVEIVKIEGIAINSTGTIIPLPNATPSATYVIGCFVTAAGNIQIDTAIDRSEYNGTVKIFYVNKN